MNVLLAFYSADNTTDCRVCSKAIGRSDMFHYFLTKNVTMKSLKCFDSHTVGWVCIKVSSL